MIEPKPAATVMIVRDSGGGIEVYLLRRSSSSAFMPDVFVFPGGRVDALDASPDAIAHLRGTPAPAGAALVLAAARETFEEAGLLFAVDPVDARTLAAARGRMLSQTHSFAEILSDLHTDIDADALRYFSRWITPPGESRRFDTRFFVGRAPAGQVAAADAAETHDGRWIAPAQGLARYAAGEFALILPTIKHLERLARFSCVDDVLAYAASKPIHPVMPDMGADAQFFIPPALEGVW